MIVKLTPSDNINTVKKINADMLGEGGVGAGSHITGFDEMLHKTIMAGNEQSVPAMPEELDKVTRADELTVEELTNLYLKLGIYSPSGARDYISTTNNADTTQTQAIKSSKASEAAASKTDSSRVNISNIANAVYPDCKVTAPEEYVDIFKRASEKYNVPYEILISVAKAESDFNKNDLSKSGAMGIMQLMPETAKWLGVTDPYDPEQNIMGGARELAEKINKHKSLKLGLAAYNAGSGAVQKYGGVPPYAETQNYVKKIADYLGVSDLDA